MATLVEGHDPLRLQESLGRRMHPEALRCSICREEVARSLEQAGSLETVQGCMGKYKKYIGHPASADWSADCLEGQAPLRAGE